MVLMKNKIKKIIKEIVIFAILLFLATNGMSLYRSASVTMDDSICSNGVDVVHFWATWCPVCKAEASNIERVAKYYKVKTVAVKSGSDAEIKNYLKQNGVSFAYVNDTDGLLAKRYNVEVFPTTVVCSDNKVKFVEVGYTSTLGLLGRLWLGQ
jgi:thiol-disulfide isomerase/thioredoxin